MIQISQNSASMNGLAPIEPNDPAVTAGQAADSSLAEAQTPAGDPLAKFGAMNGYHPAAQQFGYSSPNGSGGGSNTKAAKPAPAAANATPTAPGAAAAQALMDRGVKLLMQHKYDEALAAFEEGFRTYPDRGFILNEASTLFAAGRYGEATLAYERYLSESDAPRADEARKMLERIRTVTGGIEVTATGIAQSSAVFDAGVKAFNEGRYQDALDAFDRAFELNPVADFKFNQAACLEKLGRPYAAADRYESYASTASGAATDKTKSRDHAESLRAAADKAPITAVGPAGGQEWIARGNRLLFAHKYDEAVAAYQEGFRTYPDRAFILNEGSALLESGRFAEADLAYGRYLSEPDAPRAAEARAAQERARAAMGGREATITGIEQASKYFEQGNEHYKAGRYGEALKAFDRANELNPNPGVRYNQAACLDRLGKREQAVEKYKSYLAIAPHAADAAKVKERIAKLETQMTTVSRAAFDRGQAAYLEGRYRDAATAFGEAYEIKSNPVFLFDRAEALDKAGDTDGAVRAYQQYLNAAPDAADADKVRARIQDIQKATGNELMRP
jgi:tetratricopeptide (TPR) repeat protein